MGEEYTYFDLAISMEPVGVITKEDDLSSVVTITNSSTKTLKLWFQVEEQAVRYTICGTDPTTSLGMLLGATEWNVISVPVGNSVKFLETTSGAILQYYWLD